MPEVVGRCMDFERLERVDWQHLEAFLQLGARIPPLTVPFLQYVIEDMPAVVELLVENGIIGDHNFVDATFIEEEIYYDPFLLYDWVPRLIRWGIPMDLDSLLQTTVEYTTGRYKVLEEDRIYTGFDPRTQFRAQTFIQQLLDFGADPNVLVGTAAATDPAVVEILMRHGADPTTLVEVQGLKMAIEARQLDVVKRMVRIFPEISREDSFIFMQIIDWYIETDWQLDLELVEMLLSNGCAVNSLTIWTCIEANQQEITRKALFQPVLSPCPNPLDSDPHGPAWAPKLVRDVVCLRQREEQQRSVLFDLFDQNSNDFADLDSWDESDDSDDSDVSDSD
ncbi:hypothetical protein HK102_007304 [Quaeritorhiza haematococci]|nr:hypothetical protein HK102_007304 [Quaeritorhiza haematococci]